MTGTWRTSFSGDLFVSLGHVELWINGANDGGFGELAELWRVVVVDDHEAECFGDGESCEFGEPVVEFAAADDGGGIEDNNEVVGE